MARLDEMRAVRGAVYGSGQTARRRSCHPATVKKEMARNLHSVGDRDVRDRFRLATDKAIDGELPTTMCRELLVHAREAFRAANALFGLGPLEHEVRRQDGGYGWEVVASHEAPELARYLGWVWARHDSWSDGLGRSLAEGIMVRPLRAHE
jgi:hypothetical protein